MRAANEIKTGRARRLRRDATDAETALWSRLWSRRLNGYKFVRQGPIGPYTVDLICRDCRLIIEVDGGQHADNTCDAVRDKWLTDHNYRVPRFWNNDVLGNMAGVLETITTALAESPPPPPREWAPLTRIARATRPLPASGER
jgi:very-short-patch-repair endonuclease